jgi:TRAP-type C4-dicarboxylate transport system permease small subunit
MSAPGEAVAAGSATTPRDPLDRVADGALLLAVSALVVLALVEMWQVFARYVLNDSPSWTEPVAILCMNVAMMMGAAVGVHAQRHFGFFIAVHAAPLPVRRVLLAFSRALQAGVGLMLAAWGVRLCAATWDVPLAGVALPQGATYLPLTIGGLLIAAFALNLLVRAPDVRAEGS